MLHDLCSKAYSVSESKNKKGICCKWSILQWSGCLGLIFQFVLSFFSPVHIATFPVLGCPYSSRLSASSWGTDQYTASVSCLLASQVQTSSLLDKFCESVATADCTLVGRELNSPTGLDSPLHIKHSKRESIEDFLYSILKCISCLWMLHSVIHYGVET